MNTKALQQLQALQNIDVESIRRAMAQKIAARASDLAPRDTGFLAENVHEQDGNVVSEASYSDDIEFGTRYMQAQPFLRPAVDEHEGEILQAAANAANAEIKKAVRV